MLSQPEVRRVPERKSESVIIITTKKGRKGTGPKFSYNGDVTISTTQKRYDVLNGDQYRALVADVIGEGAAALGTANTDWQDEIFRTAVSTSHNLSITGGLKNMPYRVSAGYQSDSGIIKNSYMKRFNASVNLARPQRNRRRVLRRILPELPGN